MNRSHPLRSRAALSALAATLAACSASQPRAGDTSIADTAPALSPAVDSVNPLPAIPASHSPVAPQPPDTIRGTVAVVGSFPVTSVVVRPAGSRDVTITGPLAAEIRRAAGADVWISGTRTGEEISATRYVVRAVDGDAVADGTLALEGGRVVLVTPGARRPLARPPQALRGMIGARVWLVGPLDGTIASYGVLREP